MTSPPPYPPAVPDAGPEPVDAVLGALGALGAPVDCTGLRNLPLDGPQVLWLVVAGAMDLFAVDSAGAGNWHFLGRLESGTLLLGPVQGPSYTLVSRPLQGCMVRRIPLRELYPPAYQGQPGGQPYGQPEPGSHDGYGGPDGYGGYGGYGGSGGVGYDTGVVGSGYDTGHPGHLAHPPNGPLEDAFARGLGRGLRVLFEARVDGRPPVDDPTADDDILWMPVDPGSVQYGAAFAAESAGDLLIDGAMWQRMVTQQSRLLD